MSSSSRNRLLNDSIYAFSHGLPGAMYSVAAPVEASYACGWSLLLLALFYWVIDVQGFRKWAFFFVVIGMNAITIYFLQSIVDFDEIGKLFVQGIREHSGVLQPLLLPLGGLGLKWLSLWLLYRHRIFFRL